MNISVIMAALNAERYLSEALLSIARQSPQPNEVILVEGGSQDETLRIAARNPNIRLIAQSGTGLADAWNTGVRQAQGDTLAFLDCDDIWSPEKLAQQIAVFKNTPAIDAVVGHVKFFLSAGQKRPSTFKPGLLNGTYPAPMPGALLIRRKAFEQVGWFDERFKIAPDIDWFARLRDLKLTIITLPEVLIHKRVHQTNLSLATASQSDYQTELLRLLFEKRQRNRGSLKSAQILTS